MMCLADGSAGLDFSIAVLDLQRITHKIRK